MSQNNMEAQVKQQEKPDPALQRLDALVGKWNTEWWTKEDPSAPAVKLNGTDTYEWQHGGFFLLHHVDARMDGYDYKVLEVIGGYDAATQSYPMHSFDSKGNVQTMTARVSEEGVWTFADDTTRATLNVNEDGKTMTATWERKKEGSNWQPWMEMKFTKAE